MATEVRGMRRDETDRMLDLLGVVMNGPREYFQAIWKHSPGSRDEHSRAVFVDGRPVAHQRLYDRSIRLGRTAVREGGIGDVATHPDHRRRGYGRMILEDALEYFRAEGYDLSLIFSGVHHFYCSCGYDICPTRSCKVRTDRDVYSRSNGFHVRWFESERDLDAVSEIYDSYNGARPMTVVRGRDHWRRQLRWSRRDRAGGSLVCEVGGRGGPIGAYVRGGPGRVIEVGRLPGAQDALRACVEAVMRIAARAEVELVELACPSDEPLLRELREKFELTEETNEHTLVRFVSLPRLLDKLADELTGRLAAAGVSPTARLGLSLPEQSATLVIEDGFVSVEAGLPENPRDPRAELSQRDMLMLLSGGEFPLEAELSPMAAELLGRLFPPGGPVYWQADIV